MEKIHVLQSIIQTDGSEVFPSLKHDVGEIAKAASKLQDCRLIVIDPISAYLGGTDDHKNAELRGLLSPLKAMAEQLNVAVVLVSHLSKGGGSNGKHRVIGSIAYVGACRANFLFVRDRNDSTGRKVLMLDNGGNLAPTAPTLAYEIKDDGDGDGARVTWFEDTVDITADQALVAEMEAVRRGKEPAEKEEPLGASELQKATAWLQDALAEGSVDSDEVFSDAKECGFSRRTIEREKHA